MRQTCAIACLLVVGFSLPLPAAEPAAPATPAGKRPFTPPYPERVDPFRYPTNKAVLAARRDAAVQELDLKLKGFANVGAVRVILCIDGEMKALQAGEQHGDIQVIEINPPTVTLQRGRHRWTETLLENLPTRPDGGS